jgi:hypothetical protein
MWVADMDFRKEYRRFYYGFNERKKIWFRMHASACIVDLLETV